jgi:hypothetical protein
MPTNKPRITITLEPHIATLLDELAELQGRSKTDILGELLETIREPFERMAVILRAAKSAPAATLGRFREQIHAVESAVVPAGAAAMAQMDFLVHAIGADGLRERQPERPKAVGAVPAPKPSRSTPPSNRGVTPPRSPGSSSRKVTPISTARKPKGRGSKR